MERCRTARFGFIIFDLFTLVSYCFPQAVPFNSYRWEIDASESKLMDYQGRQALYLKGGRAVVKDSKFRDGVIEFDIAVPQERGFTGVVWRLQNLDNFEEFYIRPHMSGNPDANQYQPVFNGVTGWQLYSGVGYSASVEYDFDQWMHMKIVVSGKNAEVYIKNMEMPVLFVNELKRDVKSGKVGLNVSDFAPAYFSNFSFSPMNSPPLKGKPKSQERAPAGMIMSWMVSDVFERKSLEKKHVLTTSEKEQRI